MLFKKSHWKCYTIEMRFESLSVNLCHNGNKWRRINFETRRQKTQCCSIVTAAFTIGALKHFVIQRKEIKGHFFRAARNCRAWLGFTARISFSAPESRPREYRSLARLFHGGLQWTALRSRLSVRKRLHDWKTLGTPMRPTRIFCYLGSLALWKGTHPRQSFHYSSLFNFSNETCFFVRKIYVTGRLLLQPNCEMML